MKSAVLGLGLLVASVVYADVVSQNGIAKDSATGLTWQDESYTSAEEKVYKDDKNYAKVGNWEYAKKYCQDARLGGFSDWRLPNIYELVTLIDNTKSKAPYVINGVQNVASDGYWSSTTVASNPSDAWNVLFSYGGAWNDKSNSGYVRCVRGGQMDFVTLASLKKKGVLKVEQKQIDDISPAAEAKRKKEAQERAKRERKEAPSSKTNQNTTRSYNSWKIGSIYHRPDSYAPYSYKSTEILCSDGTKGTVFDYYNRDAYSRYLANAAKSFSQFEEAANYICGNK